MLLASFARGWEVALASIINPEAQGMLDGARHNVAWDALRPIAVSQKSMNHVEIEAGRISTDDVFFAMVFNDPEFHLNILRQQLKLKTPCAEMTPVASRPCI